MDQQQVLAENARRLYAVACLGGMGLAALANCLQRHPTRRRVWVPVGYLLVTVAAVFAATGCPPWTSGLFAGAALMAGAVGSTRHIGEPLVFVAGGIIGLQAIGLADPLSHQEVRVAWSTQDIRVLLASLCGGLFTISLWRYRRPLGETVGEWPIRVMYRLRATGPGMDQTPRTGPVLVIANHPTYLDPCWVMICLPRDLTPLMYSEYYRIPGLHFYMRHVVNAIPSGAATFRREAPELDEVVSRLDRGEGVLIFPEGWVRRTEDELLRRFAQGAWRILRDRPTTPVVACWVEGGWGSWTSFKRGPFKGWPDFRRPIDIGVAAPVVLDAETLADQHKTREVLRQIVLAARGHLKSLPSAGFTGGGSGVRAAVLEDQEPSPPTPLP